MDAFNPQVLRAVLAARHLTMRVVSERIGVTERDLRHEIDTGPSQRTINELSTQLAVPSFVFYMDHAPRLSDAIVDFRSTTPSRQGKSRQTIEAIDMAQRLQEVAEEDLAYADHLRRDLTQSSLLSAVASVRQSLRISPQVQTAAKDEREFYALCRKAVESSGVFVLHDSFPSEDGSGFCLASSRARLIVINTRGQTFGRRTFTLIHELAHAPIGETGISDPFVTNNSIERLCNRFAGVFLAPRSLAEEAFQRYVRSHEPTPQQIYSAAHFLNISQEAVVVRFIQLKLVAPDTHRRWLSAVQDRGGNPDLIPRSGGGGNVPQERVKLAKYGFTFARVFGQALHESSLSPIQIFRMSGLKPKYQRPYFDFAAAAGSGDAED